LQRNRIFTESILPKRGCLSKEYVGEREMTVTLMTKLVRNSRMLFTHAFCFAFVLCTFAGLTLSAANGNGTVTGQVLDDAGRPAGGARVLISYAPAPGSVHLAAPPVITGGLAAIAAADAQGQFTVNNLRAAKYIACAEMVTPGLLDPCHWAASAPEFAVAAGYTTSGVKVTMNKGAVLSIHVTDPQAVLKPVTGPIDPDCQFHIVTAKGFHYNANLQSSAVGSRDYAITVPYGAPISLQAIAPHLVLNDSSGKAIAATGSAVSVPAGTVPATFNYVVAGSR
jgi:hypothetical protein